MGSGRNATFRAEHSIFSISYLFPLDINCFLRSIFNLYLIIYMISRGQAILVHSGGDVGGAILHALKLHNYSLRDRHHGQMGR